MVSHEDEVLRVLPGLLQVLASLRASRTYAELLELLVVLCLGSWFRVSVRVGFGIWDLGFGV